MRTRWIGSLALSGMCVLAPALVFGQAAGSGSATTPASQGAAGQMNGMGQAGAVARQQAGSMGQAAATGGARLEPSKVYGEMLRVFEQEIVGAAQAMPPEKYSFAPTNGNFSGVRTFADEVRHLTSANYMFFKNFNIGPAPDKAKLDAMTSKADLVQALQDSFAYAQKGVDTITPENAFIGLTTGRHAETRAGNASFALAHAMDHYGQMVEYLRMNGIVPPASQHSGHM